MAIANPLVLIVAKVRVRPNQSQVSVVDPLFAGNRFQQESLDANKVTTTDIFISTTF